MTQEWATATTKRFVSGLRFLAYAPCMKQCAFPNCKRYVRYPGSTNKCQRHHSLQVAESRVKPENRLAPTVEGWSRFIGSGGYAFIRHPDRGTLPEHRYVMERMLGRELVKGESVHHMNGIRHDNRQENLELWTKPPRPGVRVEDVIKYVTTYFPYEVSLALKNRDTVT